MDQPMTKEESYAERRHLFKNIWEAAMHTDDKDPDIMWKPKVIKTLRLAEVDSCAAGKKKKQRIKNLRTVCNKILDFCDRQDADDLVYAQVAAGGPEPLPIRVDEKPKKSKHVKNKVKKAQSMITPIEEQHRNSDTVSNNISRNTSPIYIKRTIIVRRSKVKRVKINKSPKELIERETSPTKNLDAHSTTIRKVIRKKTNKRRRPFNPFSNPGSSVKYNNFFSRMLGHTPLCEPKQPQVLHKINI